jgi:hypothetical protein
VSEQNLADWLRLRESQYNKKFRHWGVRKKDLVTQISDRPTAAVLPARTDNELEGIHKTPRGNFLDAAEDTVQSLIYPWINEPDPPWCQLRSSDCGEIGRLAKRCSSGETASHPDPHPFLANVAIGSSPRSSTFSGWATFTDIHRRATDANERTQFTLRQKLSPKKSLHTVSVTESVEHRSQQPQHSPPNKTLSSHDSERASDFDLEFKSENSFDSNWINIDGTNVNEDGKVGLSRRGMLGHF